MHPFLFQINEVGVEDGYAPILFHLQIDFTGALGKVSTTPDEFSWQNR